MKKQYLNGLELPNYHNFIIYCMEDLTASGLTRLSEERAWGAFKFFNIGELNKTTLKQAKAKAKI